MSAFDDLSSLPRQQIWDCVVGRSMHGENVTFSVLELVPDGEVPEHSHANEQLGVLLHGSLTFTIGGEARTLAPGATWRILADVPHSVSVGPDGAVLAEAFAPGRSDWGAIEQQPPTPPDWL
jgi:quercetin dioxygenase-like cupin family protein